MIILKIRSVDQNSLIVYKKFLEDILFKLLVTYKVCNIPSTKKRITLLKSPHVNKKSREQFQNTRYKVFFKIKNNLDLRAIKYIISNKPKTVKVVLIRDDN